jgi:FecR protein
MNWRHRPEMLRLVAAVVLSVLVVGAVPTPSAAQQSTAELTKVVGRVEVLRKGQTQWVPGVIGAHLAEGDDIRAFSGATAELTLPDTSTVVLAENSRLLISRLELDPKNQSRTVLLHLAVGKLRATIAQAAISLVRARQSNFAISTPTAVAAARGTIVWVFTDGQGSTIAVEPQAGIRSRVDCIPLRGVQPRPGARAQAIFAGSMSTDCATPVPLQPQFLSLSNSATDGSAALLGPIIAPSPDLIFQLVTFGPIGIETPTSFFTGDPVSGPIGPPTFGRDAAVNAQGPPNPPPGLSKE